MRVIRAEVMGMCFGVRDALKAIEGISDPRGVTILGQLVHNEVVLGDLKARGFAMQHEPTGNRSGELVPGSGRVLITAHGISDRQRLLLESAGKTLIDTTCPLVVRAHQAAQALQRNGASLVTHPTSDTKYLTPITPASPERAVIGGRSRPTLQHATLAVHAPCSALRP